ncbi:hypothetical protein UFOVP770_32 [uncultured Caudovirales phage]|jgi:hypothetical protein|uniref:Uncharacterized protein n=1 Tax=uncultured Caudovirales phage TaxID=2100421 RepID=A0A6J5NU51_9CAUD|nr:hypothetical protein UFOVP770_32 [uncultured Caudovirales phage]
MAEAFVPKPGVAYLRPNTRKTEDWMADYTGTLITPEDILPNTPYFINITDRAEKGDLKFSIGKQVIPKTQESAKGADVEDDGDVPF